MRLAISKNYIQRHWDHYMHYFCSRSVFRELANVVSRDYPGFREDRRVPLSEIVKILGRDDPEELFGNVDALFGAMAEDRELPKRVRQAADFAYDWNLGEAANNIIRSGVGGLERHRLRRALLLRVIRRAEKRFLGEEK